MPGRPSAQQVLRAYASGIFPMAESRDDPTIHWVDPSRRGILPLDGFHVSRSLRRSISSGKFEPRFDTDFEGVLAGCADRDETWINDAIAGIYRELFAAGHAHCQEIWCDGRLAGGVYGVALGSAFFGESMFFRVTDASKAALAYLVHRLKATGHMLFDTQFLTPHLKSLGGIEIGRQVYLARLSEALARPADILAYELPPGPQDEVMQRRTHTS